MFIHDEHNDSVVKVSDLHFLATGIGGCMRCEQRGKSLEFIIMGVFDPAYLNHLLLKRNDTALEGVTFVVVAEEEANVPMETTEQDE